MRVWDFLALLGINAIFAGAYIAGKIGVHHFSPLFFSALRFLLVAAALAPFLRWPVLGPGRVAPFWGFCFAMGAGVYGFMYLGLASGEGVAAVLIITQFSVPIAALLGVWLNGDKIGPVAWGGIFLALGGVLAVGFDEAILGYGMAAALIFISAFFYALANVLSQRLGGVVSVLNLNAWMALVSAPVMFGLSLIWEEGQWGELVAADGRGWGVLLYSSLAVSLVGHGGMFALLRRYPVAVVMPYYVLMPIFGIGFALAFFDEAPNAVFYAGAVVALLGVWVVNVPGRRR